MKLVNGYGSKRQELKKKVYEKKVLLELSLVKKIVNGWTVNEDEGEVGVDEEDECVIE